MGGQIHIKEYIHRGTYTRRDIQTRRNIRTGEHTYRGTYMEKHSYQGGIYTWRGNIHGRTYIRRGETYIWGIYIYEKTHI